MSNFYITYFAKKHKKFITRKGQLDKPDGTQGKNFVSKNGNACLVYWDLDANGWRMAVGERKIKFPSTSVKAYAKIRERLASPL